jgi:hypothetical protein
LIEDQDGSRDLCSACGAGNNLVESLLGKYVRIGPHRSPPFYLCADKEACAERRERSEMARKTIRVSDQSGEQIPEGKGATVRITSRINARGVRELDLTDAEAEKLGGRQVARRGRRPRPKAA